MWGREERRIPSTLNAQWLLLAHPSTSQLETCWAFKTRFTVTPLSFFGQASSGLATPLRHNCIWQRCHTCWVRTHTGSSSRAGTVIFTSVSPGSSPVSGINSLHKYLLKTYHVPGTLPDLHFVKQKSFSQTSTLRWCERRKTSVWQSLFHIRQRGSTVFAVSLSWYNKYHELGGLNNRQLCLPLLEAVKSKIKMLAHSVPGEGPLLACRQMPSCCTLTQHRYRYNASHVSTYKGTNPMHEGSILCT